MNQPFVVGSWRTPMGEVPQVSAELQRADRWGTVKARWGVGRMNYKVDPGLYALGRPDSKAPVLVTANYKMSFDSLRRQLNRQDAWLLVLDTDGVNVWCAAGKGSFGTTELVERIRISNLAQVVEHRELILPQLGAPGIAVHAVRKLSGFRPRYGPILAADLPPYLANGRQATPEMRRKRFPLAERFVLIPMELVGAGKWALLIMPLLILLGGLGGPGGYWSNAFQYGLVAGMAYLIGILAGTALMPLLLPVLPGRAFAFKGVAAGLVAGLPFLAWRAASNVPANTLELAGLSLVILAVSSYYGMNFTGSSTYTSLAGVKKEMRWAVPGQIGAVLLGSVFWLISRFLY